MKFSFFNKTKKYIKLKFSYPNYKEVFKKIKNNSEKRIILIGTPIHGNLGDHLIASESINLLKDWGYNDFIEVPEFLYELFPYKIKAKKNDVIVIAGGGWMGDLYEDQMVIEDVIQRLCDNKIIILPQTVYFSGKGRFSSSDKFKSILDNNKNVYLCLRERRSYNYCLNKLNIPQDRCFLLPDMALLRMDKIKEHNKDNKKIIFSIRNDIEKSEEYEWLEKLKKELELQGYCCIDSSSVIDEKYIRIDKREQYIENKINEFADVQLVITDRLHSMIFSIIGGTKCIAFDNTTKKVSGVYDEWLKNESGLKICVGNEIINTEQIHEFLKLENPKSLNYKQNFDVINTIIKED